MAEILKKHAERINFGKIKLPDEQPDLLDIQLETYKEFVQLETTPENRKHEGLHTVSARTSPSAIQETFSFLNSLITLLTHLGIQ